YQNRAWDYLSVSLATVGVALPNFVLAVFLIILFSFVLPLFPTGGWDSPRNWVLPTVALALAPLGIIARFTRASMLEVIRADYTLTARAKGLAEIPVISKHALKNAFIPVVTLLGPMFAAAGSGSVCVDSIFRVPGMARFFGPSVPGPASRRCRIRNRTSAASTRRRPATTPWAPTSSGATSCRG